MDKLKIDILSNISKMILKQELTKRQQQVVKCVVFKNMTQVQTAKTLKLSQATVSRTLQSAMAKLNKYVKYCDMCLNMYIMKSEN